MQAFLKTGANRHATAFGSMTSVINNSTQALNDTDIAAMTTYLKSLPPAGGNGAPPYTYDPQATKVSLNSSRERRRCARLHRVLHALSRRRRTRFRADVAPLAGNPNVLEKDASSLINVTLNGTEDLVIGGIPRAVSDAEVRAGADRPADRRRADVRARRLEQRRAGRDRSRCDEAAQVDSSGPLAVVTQTGRA